ncbi:MAG: F0F1-type ATP synthase delta subunit [Flavobacteriaceae bacterium]|jgi:F0F1-type ATP synthase delta subunit
MPTPRHIAEAFISLFKAEPLKGEKIVDNFVQFLRENNLILLAPAIVHYVEEILKREEKEFSLQIESPFPLSGNIIQKLRIAFDVDPDESIIEIENKELIGGFKARRAGVQYNASIAHKLMEMKIALTR